MATKKDVIHPCIRCKYFKACGDKSRTQPCEGRELEPRKHSKFGHTENKLEPRKISVLGLVEKKR